MKYLKIILPFLLLFLLTGCKSSDVGIAQRAVVQRIGIDWDEKQGFIVSMYIITPDKLSPDGQGGSGSEESGDTNAPENNGKDKIISYGQTIYDAIKNSENTLQLKPYFSHADALVIGDSVSRESLYLLTDIFNRINDFRPSLSIYCTKGKASDIVLLGNDKPTAGDRTDSIAQLGDDNAQMSNTYLYQVIATMRDTKQDLFIPVLSTQEIGEKSILILDGTALFRDDKLIDYISAEETKYLLFAKDQVIHTTEVVQIPDLGYVSLNTNQSNTDITSKIDEDGKLYFQVKVDCSLSIEEVVNKDGKKVTKQDYNQIKAEFNRLVEENIQKLLQKIFVEYQTDTIGFSKILWCERPNVWKSVTGEDEDNMNWLLQVPIVVECQSIITDTGLTTDS